jgi:hypothetical protein
LQVRNHRAQVAPRRVDVDVGARRPSSLRSIGGPWLHSTIGDLTERELRTAGATIGKARSAASESRSARAVAQHDRKALAALDGLRRSARRRPHRRSAPAPRRWLSP